ncbi:unnamed protein product [Blepharisma stoltei]|uniref:DNA replication complex GINS protein PSF1 n=1 Tax=Blepharisma stoltei TaxID=1481888 RepID=A0AAU9JTT2_9CILI|nr:unnamed protein product [Blepharisma stoltei]
MHAEKSKKLVRELKTSKWLPPYNVALISEISQDMASLYEKAVSDLEDRNTDSALIKSSLVNRNKRCVLAYLNYRLTKLECLRLETGPNIPPHFSNQLNKDEMDYFKQYSALLQDYSRKVSKSLDLTGDLQPPKDVFVEVRATEDVGDIVLPETGQVSLEKNTVHLLRRSEAAGLIRQGVLQHIN